MQVTTGSYLHVEHFTALVFIVFGYYSVKFLANEAYVLTWVWGRLLSVAHRPTDKNMIMLLTEIPTLL
jgi:hypothetical protein